ncbi:hypothetical protein [Kitasatospora sp. NPDC056184]|uniref:hypothetical protein n=1 Tax=Kitasatospora sp. NPDC056184 TaxID=3345738 RepID=UPI0035DAB059
MSGEREYEGGERDPERPDGRWAWAARWSVVAAAGAALAVVLVTSGTDGGRPAPVTVRGTATATALVTATAVATADTGALPPHREVTPGTVPADPGPAAALGVPYALDWNTRCETGRLRFAGRSWRTGRPPVLPSGLPGAWGVGWAPPVLPGWATLTAADRLRFDAPGYLADPVLLEPAAEPAICE